MKSINDLSEMKKPTQNSGIVYLATNLVNNKKYVGITTREFSKRINEHKYDSLNRKCGHKTYFHKAICKYKYDNFSFEVIEEVFENNNTNLCNKLNELEKYYIAKFMTYNKAIGYNLTLGGDGVFGYVMPDKQKEIVSKTHKGKKLSNEHKKIISDFMSSDKNPRKGNPMPDEIKEKISKSHIGLLSGDKNPMWGKKRPDLSERNIKSGYNILQIDTTTREIIKIWNSLREISRETGWNRVCISDCCNKKTKTSHGYIWEYTNEPN